MTTFLLASRARRPVGAYTTAQGVRLGKEKASRKIDGAVALAMACWAAQQHGLRPVREG